MKKTIITIAVLATVITSACGPSKAENEVLKQHLINLKGQLAAAESKLEVAKNESTGLFDGALGGRSHDDKAQDIAARTRIVEEIKEEIKETEKQIKN